MSQHQHHQQQGRAQHEQQQEQHVDAPAGNSAQAQAHLNEVDDLLDEIDGVLATNAEEFVKGFVQKGGQ
ncbi:ubiquitin-like protein Pup [Zhihengliuella flava]|uniref:Prokaryotic ubiquitin-like protein Pup n=1 Tax=Zhihengliuella flava TaxID=1285193 RepID=A0A931D799_9MICC|nr:ubiquitin-like protein Pup [Zhihengliuella flava]MBG6083397.1 ubiquitin-like protein Pup [Zhihengliuella flava]